MNQLNILRNSNSSCSEPTVFFFDQQSQQIKTDLFFPENFGINLPSISFLVYNIQAEIVFVAVVLEFHEPFLVAFEIALSDNFADTS